VTEPVVAEGTGKDADWVALADLPPAAALAAQSLLDAAGIAVRTSDTTDGPTRVWVDRAAAADARIVLATHMPAVRESFVPLPPPGAGPLAPLTRAEVDRAWAGIVEDLAELDEAGSQVDIVAAPVRVAEGPSLDLVDLDRVEHYEPPEPPPLPRPSPGSRWAWAALIGGPAFLIGWRLLGLPAGGVALLIGLAAFVGGAVVLLAGTREREPGDDGAVV